MTVPRMRFDGLKLLQINVEASLALTHSGPTA